MGKWRGAALGGGVMLAVAGVGLVASNTLPAAGAGTAEMRVSPVSQNIPDNGQTFNVTIEARDVNNLGSTAFTIRFDNDLLEYVGTSTGPFLTSTGRTRACQGPSGGPNGETVVEIANRQGALRQGCNTFGLVTDGVGAAGSSGSGVLATVTFRPKALGLAHIDLVGLGASYEIYPAGLYDPPPTEEGARLDYDPSFGKTGLGKVEVCVAGRLCEPIGIEMDAQSAVVNIFDPNAPTPSAVPATPTKVVPQATPNARATLTAAGQIRERPASSLTSGGAAASGTTGASGSGNVAGAGDSGRPGSGASGSNGAAGTIGPDGAPIAGYGPQQEPDPWPERTVAGLAVIGLLAIGGGLWHRHRRIV